MLLVGSLVLQLWDTRSNQLVQHYDAHAGAVNSLSFHPSGDFLISSSNDNTLKASPPPGLARVPAARWVWAVSSGL